MLRCCLDKENITFIHIGGRRRRKEDASESDAIVVNINMRWLMVFSWTEKLFELMDGSKTCS